MMTAAKIRHRPIYINVLELRPFLYSKLCSRNIFTRDRLDEEAEEDGGIFDSSNNWLTEDEKVEILEAMSRHSDKSRNLTKAVREFDDKYQFTAWCWNRKNYTPYLPVPFVGDVSRQFWLQRFLSMCSWFFDRPEETSYSDLYDQCLDHGEKVMMLFEEVTGFLTLEVEFDEIASYGGETFYDEVFFFKKKPDIDWLAQLRSKPCLNQH